MTKASAQRALRRRLAAAPLTAAPAQTAPLEQIRRMLMEAAGGAPIPDVVEGVKALLTQHTQALLKYERVRELLQLEWQKRRKD